MKQWVSLIAATVSILAALGAIWVTTNHTRQLAPSETRQRVHDLEGVVGVRQTPGVPSILARLEALEARPSGVSSQRFAAAVSDLDRLKEQLQRVSQQADTTQARLTALDTISEKLARLSQRVDHLAAPPAARNIVKDNHLTFEIRRCTRATDQLSCLVSIAYNAPIIGAMDTYQVTTAYCNDDLYIFASYEKVNTSLILHQNGSYKRQPATKVDLGDESSKEYVKTNINAGDFIQTTLHFSEVPSEIARLDSLLLTYRHCFFKVAQFHDIPLSR